MNQTLHSELALSKEQLYDLFQQILGVKKFEHQLLFNALQVRIEISVRRRPRPPTVEGWGNNGWNDGIFLFFFGNYLTVGFVGRTSRRHPKRTRRPTAKSGGNGKGSFISSSSSEFFCLDQRIRTEAMRLPCFPFAFYSPSSLEHFSHLSLAYATHTVYSAFWAIGVA